MVKVQNPGRSASRTRAGVHPAAVDEEAMKMLGRIAVLPGMNREHVLDFRPRASKYLRLLSESAVLHARDIDKLAKHIESGDLQDARRIAHSVKGGAGILGAADLMAAASQFECAVEARHSPESLRKYVEAMRTSLVAIAATLHPQG